MTTTSEKSSATRPSLVRSSEAGAAAASDVLHASSDQLMWYARLRETLVVATAAPVLSDTCVRESFDGMIALADRMGTAKTLVLYCPYTAPTAAQRRMSVSAVKKTGMAERTVMLTDSVLARGAITALGWFVPKMGAVRCFPSAEVDPALQWLCEVRPRRLESATRLTKELVRAAHASADPHRSARARTAAMEPLAGALPLPLRR